MKAMMYMPDLLYMFVFIWRMDRNPTLDLRKGQAMGAAALPLNAN